MVKEVNVYYLCFQKIWLTRRNGFHYYDFPTITCTASKGDLCIPIRQCPYFNDLLNNNPIPRPRNVITAIRENQCGFKGNTPYVCCSRPTTLPPETTTEYKMVSPYSTHLSDRFSDSLTKHYNYRLLPQNICGVVSTGSRITNGQTAGLNEYPWMALIFYNSSDGIIDFRCGGSVINDRYVLTAAHCVSDPSVIGVRLGEYNVQTQIDCSPTTNYCAPPTQDFQIEKIIIHPAYNSKTFSDDIALIKLKGSANFDLDNVKPICLPVDSTLTSRSAIVAGWGVTEDGYKSQVLLQVRIPVLPLQECQKIYDNFAKITSNQICAGGSNGRDSCGGDSGGPLKEIGEVNGKMKFIQHGIVSFGPRNCGTERRPGIYTKVSSYMRWILDNLEEY
ncbi:CLIP domain-containing serine protease HP8-like isoform X2 [Diabrotica virgifera virgifera]|uniref:CLIP domain-containing serine protease n=1 Tax=Diabrotica virgifera virgifera TaxID=50390 RepID=A0ABM5KEC1_DIAVI|nr:CLIP domain-containing serine protease HP8-like isoform X2 [Diabrotica virgifera virgifera]